MSVDFAAYSGLSNTGHNMTVNEDYIYFNDMDFDGEAMFMAIADGSGSKNTMFGPASIAVHQVEKTLTRFYKKDRDLFFDKTKLLMEESFYAANDTLIGFKLGNEEERYGYATTLTCAVLMRDGTLYFAHAGNTRIYIIKNGEAIQITKDHTEAQKLVDANELSPEGYYRAMERLSLYSGMGITPNPVIQTGRIRLKQNDVVIMTTDGVHYSMKDVSFFPILMDTETMDDAAERIIQDSLSFNNYSDNLSVNVVWYLGIPEDVS